MGPQKTNFCSGLAAQDTNPDSSACSLDDKTTEVTAASPSELSKNDSRPCLIYSTQLEDCPSHYFDDRRADAALQNNDVLDKADGPTQSKTTLDPTLLLIELTFDYYSIEP